MKVVAREISPRLVLALVAMDLPIKPWHCLISLALYLMKAASKVESNAVGALPNDTETRVDSRVAC